MHTNEQNAPARMLIDCEDVAAMVGLKPSWVRDRCRPSTPETERIPGMIRLGRYVKFQRHVVEQWIANGCQPLPPKAATRIESIGAKKVSRA